MKESPADFPSATRPSMRRRGRAILLAASAALCIISVETRGQACYPPPSDMVGWWSFDEATLADGSTAADLTGSPEAFRTPNTANNGTVAGAVASSVGMVGGAALFDGASRVRVSDHPEMNVGTGSFTIDAWIRQTDNSIVRIIADKRTGGGTATLGYSFYVYQGRLGLQIGNGPAMVNYTVDPTYAIPLNTWTFVAVSVSRNAGATSLRFTVNSTSVGTISTQVHGTVSLDNTAPLQIGASTISGNSPFVGQIDELELYKRALTDDQLFSIYSAGPNGKCKVRACAPVPPGLSAWWKLDEMPFAGVTADRELWPNNGTVMGAVASNPGYVGRSASFSGAVTDYIEVPDHVDVNVGTGGFTIDAWINSRDPESRRIVVDKRSGTTTKPIGYSVYVEAGRLGLQLGSATTWANYMTPGRVISANRWHFIAVSVDRSTRTTSIRFIVDGTEVHTVNTSAFATASLDNTAPLRIGRSLVPYNLPFNGAIDEVELFQRALSSSELFAIYNADTLGKCRQSPPGDSCRVDRVILSTGYNPFTNGVEGISQPSSNWTVTAVPSGVWPGLGTPPFQAMNVTPTGWQPAFPSTRWLSAVSNVGIHPNGQYTYENCFCVRRGRNGFAPVWLYIRAKSDNAAQIWTGTRLLVTTSATSFNEADPDYQRFELSPAFLDSMGGRVCLRALVTENGTVTGINIEAWVTTINPNDPGLESPRCCRPTGTVCGTKYNDLNCNGIRDDGEPGIPGWTFSIIGNGVDATTTTDENGRYCFTVPTGSYTITERPRAGWRQTEPASGAPRAVYVSPQSVAGYDFGNCRRQPDSCLTVLRDSVYCSRDTVTGAIRYSYTAFIRSNLDCGSNPPVGSVVSVSSTAGAISLLTSGTFLPGGARTTFTFGGSGAVAGATVTLILRVCCESSDAEYKGYCCMDTVRIQLPECGIQTECGDLVEEKITCTVDASGQTSYSWCGSIKNLSGVPLGYVRFSSGSLAFSPAVVSMSGLPTGGTGTFCITITGATPGTYPVWITFMTAKRDSVCTIATRVTLTECFVPKCCPGWERSRFDLATGASWFGRTSVRGQIDVVGRGECRRMTAIEATLEEATVNSQPAGARILSAFIMSPAMSPPPASMRAVWGPMTPTVVSGPMDFRLSFPPMASNLDHDTVRWAIRLRFTDECCQTCDTLLTFERIRHRTPRLVTSGRIEPDGTGSIRIEHADPGGESLASLSIALKEEGDREITEVTSDRADAVFYTAGGVATSRFAFKAGEAVNLRLTYSGDAANVLRHELQATDLLDTMSTVQEVTIRRTGYEGGDELSEGARDVSNVRTFVLHLANLNRSSTPIAFVRLEPIGPRASILAVGPTSSDSTVELEFSKVHVRLIQPPPNVYSVSERRIGAKELTRPGRSVAPIYLTVAGVNGDTMSLRFATLTEDGEVISEGILRLSSPLTAAVGEDDRRTAVTGGIGTRVFPNPGSGTMTFEITLAQPEHNLQLKLVDQLGKVVLQLIDGESWQPGTHAVWFDGASLPDGSYFYVLSTNRGTQSGTVTLVR